MSEAHERLVGISYVEQSFSLCDYHALGGEDVSCLIEGFVGAVWSGQIKTHKRLISSAAAPKED